MPASKDREKSPARLFFFFRCEFHGTHGGHRTWVCLLDIFPGRKAAGALHSVSSVHCSPQLFLHQKKLVGKYILVTQLCGEVCSVSFLLLPLSPTAC